jgi:hypothetical protein
MLTYHSEASKPAVQSLVGDTSIMKTPIPPKTPVGRATTIKSKMLSSISRNIMLIKKLRAQEAETKIRTAALLIIQIWTEKGLYLHELSEILVRTVLVTITLQDQALPPALPVENLSAPQDPNRQADASPSNPPISDIIRHQMHQTSSDCLEHQSYCR